MGAFGLRRYARQMLNVGFEPTSNAYEGLLRTIFYLTRIPAI